MNESTIKRGSKKKITEGPVYSKEGIPYDYIVVIDSGSKGSRVYVYNWLNSYHALSKGKDLRKAEHIIPRLVKKFKTSEKSEISPVSDSESESEPGSDDESNTEGDDSRGSKGSKGKTSPEVRIPRIHSRKNWHAKIKPGISSYSSSPQKIGNHHMRHLLTLASAVVPKSQHSRTPIFLHSTAGMRLLSPEDQTSILDSICEYVQKKSDFYIPDCKTHINVIDGDTEGIYGWLAINYLIGSFDDSKNHLHGKNHTTYGLLDMGGASTQVVFEPNATEIEDHMNNLFKIHLSELPTLETKVKKKTTTYKKPASFEHHVFSDSFLGFGIFQAHNRYLQYLTEDYRKALAENSYSNHLPVSDPCLPKGYTTSLMVDNQQIDFVGASDLQKCLTSIFPVLSNGKYGAANAINNGNCNEFNEGETGSSCLLNDLIPAFDFDINHFVGVSGYWDSIRNLLSYQSKIPTSPSKVFTRKTKAKHGSKNDNLDSPESYDYRLIYNQTSKICSQSFDELLALNELKPKKNRLTEEDLSDLCFKASWILNFLNIGLGFPIFKLDELHKDKKFKSLLLADKLAGSSFSWTYGRALLYANDEFVQAYNNFTIETTPDQKSPLLDRAGFYFTASPNAFHYGAEQKDVIPRPQFVDPKDTDEYSYFDYETGDVSESGESRFYIEPHRWYGFLMFLTLLGVISWLMIGQSGRQVLYNKIRNIFSSLVRSINKRLGKDYIPVPTTIELVRYDSPEYDIEEGASVRKPSVENSSESVFQIDE